MLAIKKSPWNSEGGNIIVKYTKVIVPSTAPSLGGTQKMQLACPVAQLLRQFLTQNHYIKHLLAHPKSRVVAHLGVQVLWSQDKTVSLFFSANNVTTVEPSCQDERREGGRTEVSAILAPNFLSLQCVYSTV